MAHMIKLKPHAYIHPIIHIQNRCTTISHLHRTCPKEKHHQITSNIGVHQKQLVYYIFSGTITFKHLSLTTQPIALSFLPFFLFLFPFFLQHLQFQFHFQLDFPFLFLFLCLFPSLSLFLLHLHLHLHFTQM